jgi:hypothetical protein
MQLPPLLGNLDQDKFFIYAAADTVYFDLHAKPLINSILANTPEIGVHIHIYHPRPDQIEFCRSRAGVTCSYENPGEVDFQSVTDYWLTRTQFNNDRQRQMWKKGQKSGPGELSKLIHQTYYACARFIRLAELLRPGQRCLSIDVDGLVRSRFTDQLGSADFYLYQKPKDGTHLAGAILFNGTAGSHNFLQEYSGRLRSSIGEDDLYWFLDQVVLDQLVPQYHRGLLPMSYIDWAMRDESAIWSAKGPRKELDIFKQEQQKYLGSTQ